MSLLSIFLVLAAVAGLACMIAYLFKQHYLNTDNAAEINKVSMNEYWTSKAAREINELAGNHSAPNDVVSILKQVKLITDESAEFFKGIKDRNLDEIRNGLADVLFTVHGMYFKFGEEPKTLTGNQHILAPNESVDMAELLEVMNCIRLDMLSFNDKDVNYYSQDSNLELLKNVLYLANEMEMCVYGIARTAGVLNIVKSDYLDVCNEQYSKFDLSNDDGEKTRGKYLALGVQTKTFRRISGNTNYYVTVAYSDVEQRLGGCEVVPNGKWVKGCRHQKLTHAAMPPEEAQSMLTAICDTSFELPDLEELYAG